jgi:soluble lytic murein transglycosylase-like protein
MRCVFAILLTSFVLKAQSDPMAASVEKQKASIRLQMKRVHGDGSSFFSTAWPLASQQENISVRTTDAPVAAVPKLANPVDCDPIAAVEVDALIKQASTRHSLRDDLLKAVIQRESAFKPCAVSSKGAMGLMQLMPATAQELDVADAFDPAQNIEGGARYLKQLLDRYKGNTAMALAAYNAGAGNVDKARGIPPFDETQNFVSTILSKLPVF